MSTPVAEPVTDQEEWRRLASRYKKGPAAYIADKAATEAIAALKELHPHDWVVLYEAARARWAERLGYTDGRTAEAARQGWQNRA